MFRPSRLARSLATFAFAALLSPAHGASSEPLDVRLSDAVDPFSVSISPDGSRVVFTLLAQTVPIVSTGLVSVPIESSAATRLDPPGTGTPEIVGIAPDGSRVVFAASTEQSDSELFSIPLTGGTATKLNHALEAGARVYPGPLTPDGAQVVYVTRPADVFAADGLFVVPVAGGAPTPLEMPLPADDPRELARAFRISPDGRFGVGTWFVTFDEDFGPEPAGLFSVPLAGGPAVVLDSGGLFEGGFHQISADSRRVVYHRGGALRPGVGILMDLHSVLVSGGPSTKLNPPLAFGSVSIRFRITPDGTRVVYLARQDRDVSELYSVSVEGGPVTKLSHPEGIFGAFPWEMSPDGERVVFKQFVDSDGALYSVPVGGGAPTLLSPALVPSGDFDSVGRIPSIQVSPDGRRVVYVAEQDVDDHWDLYSVPITGGTVTRLGGPLVRGGSSFEDVDRRFTITPDGSRVIFRADPDVDGVFELFSIPIGGGATTRINGPLGPGEDVSGFSPILSSPDSRHAVYSVRRITNNRGVSALHSSRLPPAVRVDVRPRQDPNRVQVRGQGTVAVALLGSEEVDVADVDLASLAFGPGGAAPAKRAQFIDVDSDGFVDLVTRYRRQQTRIALGDTEACLAGVADGFAFHACDDIVTVGR